MSPSNPLRYEQPVAAKALSRRAVLRVLCGALPALGLSCATAKTPFVGLPVKNSIRSDQLLIVSDIKLPKDHPLIADLKMLRRQVSEELELPLGSKPVTVYLFTNETEYTQYLHATFPGYPPRRAYFIQTPGKDLAVYTWWGDRIQEDLRHEFTHGLLHASLEGVPLWLDEGLAEYFEVVGYPGSINVEHAQLLAKEVHNGWRPNLDQLEKLEKVEQMKRPHYREAWAWVHYMLHGSPETRQVMLNYIHELRTNANPGLLHERLLIDNPDADLRLLSYIASMNVPAAVFNPAGGPVHRAAMYHGATGQR